MGAGNAQRHCAALRRSFAFRRKANRLKLCFTTYFSRFWAKKGVFSLQVKYSASEKVAGGKLVSIELSAEENVISGVKITGDFFLHPEESISDLESSLVGVKIPFDWIDTEKKLLAVITDKRLELVGVKSGNIISVMQKAVSEGPK